MPFEMKLGVTPGIVLLLSSFAFAGCSGSSASPLGSTPDSGSTSTGDDSGGNTGEGGSTGDGGSCTIATDWSNNSNGAACDSCEQQHCCPAIAACNSDKGCKAIFDCQVNCYSGIGLDGGSVVGDGGPVDDAGDTTEDLCAQACITLQPSASQALFTTQDDCVNGTAANQCGAVAVCN